MKFQDDTDFTTLNWIKSELDATLRRASEALQAHVASPGDTARMREVVGQLHIVQGTLYMVELYGAALVVDEMERVARGIADGSIVPNDDIYSVLMRGVVQMPDYLEGLQSGQKDVPLVLLPLLNDLRAARGERLLSESALFMPNLEMPLPPAASAAASGADVAGEARRLRVVYEAALLRWIRNHSADTSLRRMSEVFEQLEKFSADKDDARRVWWVANGMLDGVRGASVPASVAVMLLFGKLDREIKRFIDEGAAGFAAAKAPRDLTRSLLYYIARAKVDTPRGIGIRELYHLDALLPSAQELEQARDVVSGRNRALLDTVATTIKEHLLGVKEALDICLRQGGKDVSGLAVQADTLDRIADALGVLGIDESRRHVIEQSRILADIAAGHRPADMPTLFDVADVLLRVEVALDEYVARQTEEGRIADSGGQGEGLELPRLEIDRILDALMREAMTNIAQCKADVVEFIEAPWDFSRVERTSRLLDEVSGALGILEQHDAAQLVTGLARYIQIELLQQRYVPDREQFDALADALASIEYYLEAMREHRGGRDHTLAVTRDRLAALGYWPVPEAPVMAVTVPVLPAPSSEPDAPVRAEAPVSAPAAVSTPETPASAPSSSVAAPVLPSSSVAVPPAADAGSGNGGMNQGIEFGFTGDAAATLDDEIRDIFLEEVGEEIVNLETNLPGWLAQPDDFELLRTIRRSFHTLKGSGRLVGALALGDFSWKIENMLNRVLDKTIAPGKGVFTLVGYAVAALPGFVAALRGEGRPDVEISVIKDTADRLASGEDVVLAAAALRPARQAAASPAPAAQSGMAATPEVSRQPDEIPAEVPPPVEPQIDAVLLDVLRTETDGQLAAIDEFVREARAAPAAIQATPAVLRAVHTLNGTIAVVDLPQISAALQPLEDYTKRLQVWQQAIDEEGLVALADVARMVRESVAALGRPGAHLPDFGELTQRIVELRDVLPEPSLLQSLLESEGKESHDDEEPPASAALAAAPSEAGHDAQSAVAVGGATPAVEAQTHESTQAPAQIAGDTEAPAEAAPALGEEAPVVEPAAEPEADAEVDAVAVTDPGLLALIEADAARAETARIEAGQRAEAQRLAAANASAAPPPVAEISEDLLDIFVREAQEYLDQSDAPMVKLHANAHDREAAVELQRNLHTIKGGAYMAGLKPVGDLSHAMESLFEAVGEQRRAASPAVIQALETGFDHLNGLVERVARHQPLDMPVDLIARMESLVHGDPEPAPGAAGDAGAAKPPVVAPAQIVDAGEEAEPDQRGVEYVRVRSELLDSMINTAGEVTIYRSRLEQQVAGYTTNLGELGATIARLRDQLHRLEIETEAQILSRNQRADDQGMSNFDPLELDRFTQVQQLSRSMSESVSDLGAIQVSLEDLARQSESLLQRQSRMSGELQDDLMRARMVPFESIVPSLRRTLRQTAAALGKRAQLKVEGAQGEMDRNLLEHMKAPLEHMLRNALAHGIEAPTERFARGKPEEGTVDIAVSREATEVVLRVRDDGRGLNTGAIRRRAVERGVLAANAQISERELYNFILDFGFSTAESVDRIAGRGVGMEVVYNHVKQLGGSLEIDSEPGKGATFTVRLPFTMAATQAIVVRIGEVSYAIPMSAVVGVVRVARNDLDKRMAAPDPAYTYSGETYAVYSLASLIGVPPAAEVEDNQIPLLMTRIGNQRAALRIDAVLGSYEIVIKSVGPQISSVPGILGATVMGDGSVVMILDLSPLLRRIVATRAQTSPVQPVEPPPVVARKSLIMVVDDSITMRKATSRVLERAGMEVMTAKDGVDAVEKLQEAIPDLVVLDIEMPRMDGYEFATYMKNDARTRDVPIIMVTSRTGEKHRQRAQEIGVERYLGKPYQDTELLQNIREALGGQS